jgi:putative transposase
VERWTAHAGGVCEIRYRFVWCPKYRRPVLTGDIATRLDAVLRAICDDLRADIMALEIMPDHVHLLMRMPDASLAPAQIAFRLKGTSSHRLRQEFPSLRSRLPTLWSRSYYVGTVGAVSKAAIARYIAAQKGR